MGGGGGLDLHIEIKMTAEGAQKRNYALKIVRNKRKKQGTSLHVAGCIRYPKPCMLIGNIKTKLKLGIDCVHMSVRLSTYC